MQNHSRSNIAHLIAEAGASLSERKLFTLTSSETRQNTYNLVDLWREKAGGCTPKRFLERLRLSGISISCLDALENAHAADESELPVWAATLKEIVVRDSEYAVLGQPLGSLPTLLRPFVETALSLLQRQHHIEELFTEQSLRASLERDVIRQLSFIMAEYKQQVFLQTNTKNISEKKTNQSSYSDDNTSDLLRTFPVLTRDLSLAAYFWVTHVSELLDRLTQDEPFLRGAMWQRIIAAQLKNIRTGLSEPHRSGRTVSQLTFHGGLKLIYKPHDIGIESAWRNLITWLNERSGLLDLAAVKSYPRNGYGWAEYVPNTPCQNEGEIKRYYQRVGYLLAILYFLGASDIHRENLIASGGYPVIVDLETILNPTLKDWERYHNVDRTERYQILFDDSVVRTGLLPRQNSASSPEIFDMCALGMPTESLIDHHHEINTNSSLPLLGRRHIGPAQFVDIICSSFGEMYEVLVQNAEALLSTSGPIQKFLPYTTRYVFRPTSFYVEILRQTHSGICLRNGLARSICLDALLVKDYLEDEISNSRVDLINSEVEALELRDIPIFRTHISSKSLMLHNNQVISDFFTETGVDALKRRLASSSDTNRKFQEIVIMNSLCV